MGAAMQFIDNLLRRICEIVGFIGVAAILALMALTVVTVVFRALHIAFPGTYSLSELLLIPAVSLSLAYAAVKNEHTRVVLLVDRIKNERASSILHGIMLMIGSLFWVFVAWATIREAIRKGAQGELSPIINVPVAPFRWSMAAALVLLIVVLLWQGFKLLRGLKFEENSHSLDQHS